MKRTIIGHRTIAVAALMVLIVVGAVVALDKPPQAAQPTERRVCTSPPVEVGVGYRVRSAAFNAGQAGVSVRFRLLDGVTGESIAGSVSETFDLPPRTGALFDTEIVAGNISASREIVGNVICGAGQGNGLRASMQVFDADGQTTAFMTMDEMSGS